MQAQQVKNKQFGIGNIKNVINKMRAGTVTKAAFADNQLAGGSIDPEAWVDGEEF